MIPIIDPNDCCDTVMILTADDVNVLDGPLKDVILGMSKEMELDPGVLLTLLMPVNYTLAKIPTGKSARSSNS